ncbi:MAG: hypothetical protein ACSLEX_01840 [Minisyncoccota bacterium]
MAGYRLGKNIIATVAYYDVMDMPLTAFEIWKHLMYHQTPSHTDIQANTLAEVMTFLWSEQVSDKIHQQYGFYFLVGREHLVEKRIFLEKISVSKLKRMRRLARLLVYVPYVRMLGATGSLAMKHGTRRSDWDMFVVLCSGKIWTGRTILTGFLQSIGKRRHGKKIQDRACLNYFVTDDNLEIGTKDLFSSHEYRFFIPLIGFDVFQVFELKNIWMRQYRPNFSLTVLPSLWTLQKGKVAIIVRNVLEHVLNRVHLEHWLATWQEDKIRRNPKTLLHGSLIETSERALIFLPRPRGPRVFAQFKERLPL